MSQQLALAVQLNNEATLADFCWKGNELLEQQLTQATTGRGERLLYLWGNKGCGKSHLLQACCQDATNSNQAAVYLPLPALKEFGPDILEGMEKQNLICIDDIDTIAQNPIWEEALFHLYNRVKDNDQTIIIISGKSPPANMPVNLADLRSRLSWGLALQINELDDEDKINTIKLYANKRGFELSTSVSQFLLNHFDRNMHELQKLLNRLDEASLSAKRKITIPFVKNIFKI